MRHSEFICGIIPALITPMTEDENLDEQGLRMLIDYVIDAGVDGIFVGGTAGEFWALTVAEKKRLFEWAVLHVNNRVPVFASTGANTTREAAQLAEIAERAGVDGLSVLTPNFITPSDQQMFRHYAEIAHVVDLPILLYTNPDRTGNPLSVDLVVRLTEQTENIVGIKDSAGDLTLTAKYLRRTPQDFRVLLGRDTLIYAGLQHGAHGAIVASANIAPKLSVDIFQSFTFGQFDAAQDTQNTLARLRQAFGLGTFPAILKTGVEFVGLPAGPPRAPITRLNHSERQQLRAVLEEIGILKSVSYKLEGQLLTV